MRLLLKEIGLILLLWAFSALVVLGILWVGGWK